MTTVEANNSRKSSNSEDESVLSMIWSKINNLSSGGSKKSRNYCRICHDEDPKNELISPCKCSGTVGLIHKSCLEKWLSASNDDKCEICGFKFSVTKHTQSFIQWLCDNNNDESKPTVIGDMICFILLTPMAFLSAYLCGLGITLYMKYHQEEALGLITLAAILIVLYIVWFAITLSYHRRKWAKWSNNHQLVELVQVSIINNEDLTT